MTITNEQLIDELLTRSVKEILPTKEALKDQLLSGKKLRIYIGTDATGTSLHIGHATNYIILEKFRKLGHEVIFLIGDFTSRIGDPTDKTAARIPLTREQVVENIKTWIDQIRPIIDVENEENPVRILYNHDWLSKLSFEEILNLASHFTVQQMIERDMFQKRLEENKPIHLHEFLYPLMQGYDSVAMDVDIEMCGNDQKFNALAGRTLQKKINNKEKFIFITTLLENPRTGEKMMSKSAGTGVFLDFSPDDMFGGIMAQPDENMKQLFIDCTLLPVSEINEILEGNNPKDTKLRLSFEITKLYHGNSVAEKAQMNWEKIFSKGELPETITEIPGVKGKLLSEVFVDNKILGSRAEFRRLTSEGGLKIINKDLKEERIDDFRYSITETITVKVGKKKFVKVVIH